ncbi:MAG TPA: NUDIX domain-containing protein [Chitinophagaceae bacterium]|jgi:predicted NUDIX family NTP pyrophosphohydrolase|nr:NUDIX domain-containing protein [Chitinophagaceae bacterium]
MTRKSAGILLYRLKHQKPEVLLVHPGGPFWMHKDASAWSIPKGEFTEEEDPLDAALRELAEETGITITGPLTALPPVKQKGGKMVYAWAAKGDCDPAAIKSNTFSIEWPPRSGRTAIFPEIDKAAWFSFMDAREKIISGQIPLLDALEKKLAKP